MIELNIKLKGPQRGPGMWKLNTSINKEDAFRCKMKDLIERIWVESSDLLDCAVRFDWLKFNIRQFSMDEKTIKDQK